MSSVLSSLRNLAMRRFNIIFLAVNILLLAGALYLYSAARARERRHFDQLKPVLMKTYQEFNMKLPYEDPKDMDELLAPLDALTRGLSK